LKRLFALGWEEEATFIVFLETERFGAEILDPGNLKGSLQNEYLSFWLGSTTS
jgi:hypothetical protein